MEMVKYWKKPKEYNKLLPVGFLAQSDLADEVVNRLEWFRTWDECAAAIRSDIEKLAEMYREEGRRAEWDIIALDAAREGDEDPGRSGMSF